MSCPSQKVSHSSLHCIASAAGSRDWVAGAILCAFCSQNKVAESDLTKAMYCPVAQGAVAVEGEAHLWRPGRGGPPLPTSAAHMGHSASDAAAQLAAEGQMELDGMAAPAAGSRAQAQPGHQAEGDDTGAVAAAGENCWLACRQDMHMPTGCIR